MEGRVCDGFKFTERQAFQVMYCASRHVYFIVLLLAILFTSHLRYLFNVSPHACILYLCSRLGPCHEGSLDAIRYTVFFLFELAWDGFLGAELKEYH